MSLSPPVRFSRVGIGRASLPAPSPNTIMSVSNNGVRSLPETRGGPTHCEPSRVYSVEPGAVKFGDKPHSHVTLQKLWLRNGMPKNFSLVFDFRTHYPNGLLFLLPVSIGYIYLCILSSNIPFVFKNKTYTIYKYYKCF